MWCRKFDRLKYKVQAIVFLDADPDDDKILECAVAGGASHVVTGDLRHLIPLGAYQGISIVTPANFVALVANLSR